MADRTAKFESAQALFCAIADKVGSSKIDNTLNLEEYKTYSDFKKDHKALIKQAVNYIDVSASLQEMEELLSEKEWYISSVKIAKKLINFLHEEVDPDFGGIKRANFGKWNYFRGDIPIMGKISELFTIANNNTKYNTRTKQVRFGQLNKWNPADIYYASIKAKNDIAKELLAAKGEEGPINRHNYDFGKLNALSNGLLDSGDLLPLSLKKVEKGEAHLQKVNFSPTIKQKLIHGVATRGGIKGGLWYKGHTGYITYQRPKRRKYPNLEPIQDTTARDFKIMVSDNNGRNGEVGYIQFRHDPSSGGPTGALKVDFHYAKADARGGSVTSIDLFTELMSFANKTVSGKVKTAWNDGVKAFAAEYRGGSTKKAYKDETGTMQDVGAPKGMGGKTGWGIKGLDSHREIIKNAWNSKKTRYKNRDNAFNSIRGEISAHNVVNKFLPKLVTWCDSKGTKGKKVNEIDEFIRVLFQYVTSRSKTASWFVIAK